MKKHLNRILMLVIVALTILSVINYYPASIEAAQPYLYWGKSGSSVITLQRRLSWWGYYDGPIDGIYGTETSLAVREFQAKNRLKVDGVVGPETWAALGYEGVSNQSTTTTSSSSAVSRENDVYLIARLVHAEARAEPFEGQVAVAAVLLNRVESSQFPNSIAGVIYQPLAFESVANGQFNLSPTEENIKAARSALNGWDPTYGALFFWNPSKPVNSWIWSRPIVRRIGNHVFAR